MGEDYRSIATLLEKSPKSIDNALQRIKQKISTILE
jgi:RNA polymerase sporulation-specific sigma factor